MKQVKAWSGKVVAVNGRIYLKHNRVFVDPMITVVSNIVDFEPHWVRIGVSVDGDYGKVLAGNVVIRRTNNSYAVDIFTEYRENLAFFLDLWEYVGKEVIVSLDMR